MNDDGDENAEYEIEEEVEQDMREQVDVETSDAPSVFEDTKCKEGEVFLNSKVQD